MGSHDTFLNKAMRAAGVVSDLRNPSGGDRLSGQDGRDSGKKLIWNGKFNHLGPESESLRSTQFRFGAQAGVASR